MSRLLLWRLCVECDSLFNSSLLSSRRWLQYCEDMECAGLHETSMTMSSSTSYNAPGGSQDSPVMHDMHLI